jgi:NAD-dependent dihydropyrimidine dehydrogenase PreA subunit
MKINQDKCTGCWNCFEYCPAGAFKENDEDSLKKIYIDDDLCFECGLCRRIMICPEGAFEESSDIDQFPRVVRALFSDPNTTHKLTMVPGRGTEESKTNDVTGRIKRGQVGLCIEFGRPGAGSTFRDISLMTTRLKALGIPFEPNNPVTQLMDPETGSFPDSLLPERVLSAIIEIKLGHLYELEKVIPAIRDVSQEIDTVFSLSVISRFDESGEPAVLEMLTSLGISYAPNAKVNLGLGKPLVED